MPTAFLETPATTTIGSLPHHNIDAALAFAFRTSIPFLPQIPIRNPWEYMIAQALEGMPGLEIDRDGTAALNLDVWLGRSKAFNEKLLSAFEHANEKEAFATFEPSSAASSSWQPFLWELEERKIKAAKLQIAGPITSQWVLRLKDGSHTEKHPEISAQIFRLVLARAIAMSRRLTGLGILPLFYLDEPGLYALTPGNARHVLVMQELKLMVQALKKENVLVGIHCCSNTHWPSVFQSGIDILSLDTGLSLEGVLEAVDHLEPFIKGGGRLSLGVIPTAKELESPNKLDAREIKAKLEETFQNKLPHQKALRNQILQEAIYTPACGLALHDPNGAEMILATLLEFRSLLG